MSSAPPPEPEPDPLDLEPIPLAAEPTSPDPAPDPPLAFNPAARAAFRQMARDCGYTIFRMPGSCEMYLRQYLADFEPERLALIEGLRREVPHKIAQFTEPEGYEEFLLELSENYATATGVSREIAWWVVTGWATAQGRPARTPTERVVESPAVPTEPRPPSRQQQTALRWAMCGIAAGGGFLGGLVGLALPLVILFSTDTLIDSSGEAARNKTAIAAVGSIIILLFCGLGSSGAAIGAGFGWYMGRGNQYPWTGFGAAFASTATVAATFGFCCGPLNPITVIVLGVTAFGAAYTAAARGGYST